MMSELTCRKCGAPADEGQTKFWRETYCNKEVQDVPFICPECIEKYGSICEDCGQHMLEADGCTMRFIRFEGDGVFYERIPFNHPRDLHPAFPEGSRCPDCGALDGHPHHYGCDHERCPKCDRQMLMCVCGGEKVELMAENLLGRRVIGIDG